MIWLGISAHLPKNQRYTIGSRIENKFLDLLEIAYLAYFTPKEKKSEGIAKCILSLDKLKFLLYVAWEAKLISHKQYEEIIIKMDEIGKILGGWKKSQENPENKNRTL